MTDDRIETGPAEDDTRKSAASRDEGSPSAEKLSGSAAASRASDLARRRLALNDWPTPFRACPPRGMGQR